MTAREIRSLDGAQQERAIALLQASLERDRRRMTYAPPAPRGELLCGCPPDPEIGCCSVDQHGGCLRCSS